MQTKKSLTLCRVVVKVQILSGKMVKMSKAALRIRILALISIIWILIAFAYCIDRDSGSYLNNYRFDYSGFLFHFDLIGILPVAVILGLLWIIQDNCAIAKSLFTPKDGVNETKDEANSKTIKEVIPMKYKIYRHPSDVIDAVKQGWSWPAFFFPLPWSLLKSLWLIAFIFAFLFIVFSALLSGAGGEGTINGFLELTLILGSRILFGRFGNTWREEKLTSSGFVIMETVVASNKAMALDIILKRENCNAMDSENA